MKATPIVIQRLHLITAALLILVGIFIALLVIQPVASDTYPGVMHDRIVFIWGVNISLNLIVAFVVVLFSFLSKAKGCIITVAYIILLFIIFILGFSCSDAAQAYLKHGPEMQMATITLFCCAAIELIAWILLLITLIQRSKLLKSNSSE